MNLAVIWVLFLATAAAATLLIEIGGQLWAKTSNERDDGQLEIPLTKPVCILLHICMLSASRLKPDYP